MEECGDALGRWLRLLRRQLVTGIFHHRGWVPAWGRPGDAARAFPEELMGKIRSDACLWAWGMESLGPFS